MQEVREFLGEMTAVGNPGELMDRVQEAFGEMPVLEGISTSPRAGVRVGMPLAIALGPDREIVAGDEKLLARLELKGSFRKAHERPAKPSRKPSKGPDGPSGMGR